MEIPLLRREEGRRKPDVATFAFLLGWLFFMISGIEGLTDSPPETHLITASESGWVFLWYSIAMVVAGLGGLIATFKGLREAEASALFVVAGLIGLHGVTLLWYAETEADDFFGLRMIGGSMVLLTFAISLRRVGKLDRQVRAEMEKAEREEA
jgi:hypothetical protein